MIVFYFCYFIRSVSVPFFLYKIRISELEKEDEKEFKVVVTGRRGGKTANVIVESLDETKKRLQSYNEDFWIDEVEDFSNTVYNKQKKIRKKKIEVELLHHDRLIRLDEE